MNNRKTGAVILAAGRGSRMQLKNINKTTLLLNGKPLILYPVELFEKMKIKPVVIVVGHAKESVKKVLEKTGVVFAEQDKRLGTGHAVKCSLPYLPDVTDLLVINGDDAYIYTQELINKLISKHLTANASLTLLTLKIDDPAGIGRIIRDANNKIIKIIEEKDADDEEREIKEININCFIFRKDFLIKYLPQLPKSEVTGEYYLTGLVKLASDNNVRIETVDGGSLPWRGVNTKEELEKAHDILLTLK